MDVKQIAGGKVCIPICLRDYMDAGDGWGVAEGRIVHARLLDAVEAHLLAERQATFVFQISLKGVRRTDASFPRESVMQLAHRFREQHGFCLWHLDDPDLIENWEAAARRRVQPMLSWNGTVREAKARLIGPPLTEGLRGIFDTLLSAGLGATDSALELATPDIAARLGLSVSNASNKLKALWAGGYILRREQVAPSGGIEFRYFVAR